jgi:hypothetical protein
VVCRVPPRWESREDPRTIMEIFGEPGGGAPGLVMPRHGQWVPGLPGPIPSDSWHIRLIEREGGYIGVEERRKVGEGYELLISICPTRNWFVAYESHPYVSTYAATLKLPGVTSPLLASWRVRGWRFQPRS